MNSNLSSAIEDPPFVVGLDLGQARDPSAIAIVRKVDGASRRPLFYCGFLQRVPLGTTYPSIIAHVGRLMERLPGPASLAIDMSGVGRPVYDLFVYAGFSPTGITITSGDSVTRESSNILRIPKLTLISRTSALLHSGQLKIQKNLADAPTLIRELGDMRANFTEHGHLQVSARVGRHDDLCLALAIALYVAHGDSMESYGMFEFYREQYGGGAPPEIVPQVAEDPIVEPPPGDPFGFYIGPESAAPAGVVLMQAPVGTSAANGLSGKLYRPNAAGLFEMSELDAKPLITHGRGWVRVV
jgi:hypothetical protein